MTIITESLISECQSLSAICLNKVLDIVYRRSISQVVDLNLPFDLGSKDIQKIIKHNLVIELCEFKKSIPQHSQMFIKRDEYSSDYLQLIDDIVNRMELYKPEKSANLIRDFTKYLRKNGFTYLSNVYLKQVSNKLALFR